MFFLCDLEFQNIKNENLKSWFLSYVIWSFKTWKIKTLESHYEDKLPKYKKWNLVHTKLSSNHE